MGTPVAEARATAVVEIATLIAREAPEEILFGTVAEHVAHHLGADAASVLQFVGDERAVIVGVWRDGGGAGSAFARGLDELLLIAAALSLAGALAAAVLVRQRDLWGS